jgi:putative transposase
MIEALRKVIKRLHDPLEVILIRVRWYMAYPPRLRHIEEMMAERGAFVDHAAIHRWSLKMVPASANAFCRGKRPMGESWHIDEAYIKIRDRRASLHRAVDRDGDTTAFLLPARRDKATARHFLTCALDRHGKPEAITTDKSSASTAATESYDGDPGADSEIRHRKYPNNIVELGRRAIERIIRPTLGFKSIYCTRPLPAGIKTMHMIRRRQPASPDGRAASATTAFYSLAY